MVPKQPNEKMDIHREDAIYLIKVQMANQHKENIKARLVTREVYLNTIMVYLYGFILIAAIKNAISSNIQADVEKLDL